MIENTHSNDVRSWVIHPDIKSHFGRKSAEPALKEAVALASALPKLKVKGSTLIILTRPKAGMLFGKGKIEELRRVFAYNEIELVLIDGPLTPVQQRNLEKIWSVKILDRTGLILEIFSARAATREGVLQVEMAALTYQRTRLVRAWTHLERQRGGLGFVGGPGETQIEADRRAIDLQLSKLREQLTKVVKTRTLHRLARASIPYPIVALVGYTNAGKSTLFNRLTGEKVLARDMLFATLDPCMRTIRTKNGARVILSDTVGFVSDLPTELVAAFKATLEEVLSADIILHVRDISHEASQEQANQVNSILKTLGVKEETPFFEIWNKADLLSKEGQDFFSNQSKRKQDVYLSSAINGTGIECIIGAIEDHVTSDRFEDTVFLPHKEGKKRAWLYQQGVVINEEILETGTDLVLFWSARQKAQFYSN